MCPEEGARALTDRFRSVCLYEDISAVKARSARPRRVVIALCFHQL